MSLILRKILTAILLSWSYILPAQGVFISDCNENKPIIYAHIQNVTTGVNAVSNSEGSFQLSYLTEYDIIEITHISYQPIRITIGQLLNNLEICLNPSARYLEEVVIESSSTYDFLMTAIRNTQAKLMVPRKIKAYYKEFVSRDHDFTHFCDADIVYHISKKKEALKIKGQVLGSRVYVLPVPENDSEYLDLDIISPIDYTKTMSYYDPKNIGKFLSKGDKYEYTLLESEDNYIIEVKPDSAKEGIYQGKILVDKSDSTLVSVQFDIPEERKIYTKEVNAVIARLKVMQYIGHMVYTKNPEGLIYPVFLRMQIDIKIVNKKKINQDNSFITEINIYDIPEDQSDIQRSQIYNKNSIYKRGTSFSSEYWKDKPLSGLSDGEKLVIENLEKGVIE